MSFFDSLRSFLNNYSWSVFYELKPMAFSLVLLFFVLSIILNLIGRGTGEELSRLLIRSVCVIFALCFFRQLIEGTKDIVWSIELQINPVSFESQIGRLFDPHDQTLSTYFLKLFLFIAKTLFFLLQLIFAYLWVLVIASAPIFIPMFLIEVFEGYAQKWFGLLIALFMIRIPWSFLAKMMSILSKQKFEGFFNGSFASITLPLFFGVLAVACTATILLESISSVNPGMGLLKGAKNSFGKSLMAKYSNRNQVEAEDRLSLEGTNVDSSIDDTSEKVIPRSNKRRRSRRT